MAGARVEATADRGSNDPGQNLHTGDGMRRILAVSLMLVALPGLVAPALAQAVGIVLMHGKTGSPNTVIDRLASDLQSADIWSIPPRCAGRDSASMTARF